ncbi:MAG TPA: DUF3556 domain-containing protein [Kofleriaceae bacterium]|nr:DUF3556 domain-containing protein [Kofleriaceae bacterium]
MSLLRPAPVPYDALAWAKRPFPERARMVCEAWALQGYGTPPAIYLLHIFKIALYIGVWVVCCSFTPGLGRLSAIGDWWLSPIAFEKAILWSMMFEGLGLGCGFGPLTGHYFPPMGGVLHFLRPGTTKAAVFPRLAVLGGTRRSWLDVALYLALMAATVRALIAPAIGPSQILPIVALVPIVGLCDRTIFLALRAEHYWTTAVCFAIAGGSIGGSGGGSGGASVDWIAGAKAVQLALWFWAGFSKLNHHFPSVVCVMTSNSPVIRFAWLRRRMYRSYPDDLRPSRLAVAMGHAGTALELTVPIILLISPGGPTLAIGLVLMLVLHTFITSNVPLGVPLEWNVMVVYGAFALFWAHPELRVLDLVAAHPGLAGFLAIMLIAAPLFGNLVPSRLSFLLAMRFYAGNWPYSVWLFRGESYRKLERLTKSTPWVYEQLDRFYDRPTSVGLVGKVMGFRLMHLQGRALPILIPKAVDRLEDYEYLDGELVAGIVLGWNFGDGHLHREPLLAAVQEQCGFEPGELRCIFVEGQPFGRPTMAYRIHDAATGLIDAGTLDVRELRHRQPWAAA